AATAKLTFAPAVILLFCMTSRARIRASLITSVVAGILLISPIWVRVRNLAGWLVALTIHSGSYGEGDRTVVDWPQIPGRVEVLIAAYPVAALAMLVLVLVIARHWFQGTAANSVMRSGAKRFLYAI